MNENVVLCIKYFKRSGIMENLIDPEILNMIRQNIQTLKEQQDREALLSLFFYIKEKKPHSK